MCGQERTYKVLQGFSVPTKIVVEQNALLQLTVTPSGKRKKRHKIDRLDRFQCTIIGPAKKTIESEYDWATKRHQFRFWLEDVGQYKGFVFWMYAHGSEMYDPGKGTRYYKGELVAWFTVVVTTSANDNSTSLNCTPSSAVTPANGPVSILHPNPSLALNLIQSPPSSPNANSPVGRWVLNTSLVSHNAALDAYQSLMLSKDPYRWVPHECNAKWRSSSELLQGLRAFRVRRVTFIGNSRLRTQFFDVLGMLSSLQGDPEKPELQPFKSHYYVNATVHGIDFRFAWMPDPPKQQTKPPSKELNTSATVALYTEIVDRLAHPCQTDLNDTAGIFVIVLTLGAGNYARYCDGNTSNILTNFAPVRSLKNSCNPRQTLIILQSAMAVHDLCLKHPNDLNYALNNYQVMYLNKVMRQFALIEGLAFHDVHALTAARGDTSADGIHYYSHLRFFGNSVSLTASIYLMDFIFRLAEDFCELSPNSTNCTQIRRVHTIPLVAG